MQRLQVSQTKQVVDGPYSQMVACPDISLTLTTIKVLVVNAWYDSFCKCYFASLSRHLWSSNQGFLVYRAHLVLATTCHNPNDQKPCLLPMLHHEDRNVKRNIKSLCAVLDILRRMWATSTRVGIRKSSSMMIVLPLIAMRSFTWTQHARICCTQPQGHRLLTCPDWTTM